MTFNVEFEVCLPGRVWVWVGVGVWPGLAERCQDDLSTRHAQRHKTQTVRMYLRTDVSATVCIVFVSVSAARTSWATCWTWFFMRLHIKNDGKPAASQARCFACLMTTTKKQKKNVKKKTARKQQFTVRVSLATSLCLPLSLCFSVSFPAWLGLIFDSSIINHTLTFHTHIHC